MSWDEITLDTPGRGPVGPSAIEWLFEEQLGSWPLLAQGVRGLARATSRPVQVGAVSLTAWHLPHRIRSTAADVDDASVRDRPCFLCPENLPKGERALPFGEGYFVTCNPYPILPRHVSVVAREHRPQEIARDPGDFRMMLELAARLPEYLVLYNGPECGASAPDHMHLQACLRRGVPVFGYKGEPATYPAGFLLLAHDSPEALTERFFEAMARLRSFVPGAREAMVNVVAVREANRWTVRIFPRCRHRPEVFHSGELVWSPGALDLAGMLVLPREADLERVTGEVVQRGFGEVCLPAAELRSLAISLELS